MKKMHWYGKLLLKLEEVKDKKLKEELSFLIENTRWETKINTYNEILLTLLEEMMNE